MRNLCSLIFLIASPAFAANQLLYSEVQYQSQLQKPVLAGSSPDTQVQRSSQTLEYRLESIKETFNLSVGTIISQPDYSTYTVRDQDGITRPLATVSNTPKNEAAVRVGASASRGTHTGLMRYTQTATETPFASQRLELKAEESLFDKTTTFGADFARARRTQPESYFINPRDFQTRSRPREVNTTQYGVFYEQVLTNKWKAMLRLDTEEQPEERPRNFGALMRHSYAVNKRVFAHVGGGYRFENQGEPLRNERGYFSLWRYDMGVVVEPKYDLLLKFSYGLMSESEYEPSTKQTTRVGSDHLNAGATYNFGEYEVGVNTQYSFSQIGNSGSAMGSLLWTF